MSWPWPFKRKQSTDANGGRTESESDVFRYSVILPYETIPANTMLYRAAPTVEEQPTPRECKDTFKVGVYFSMNHPYLAETMIAEKQFDMPIAMYKTTKAFRVVVGKYAVPGKPQRELDALELSVCGPAFVGVVCENLSELTDESHVDRRVLPLYDTTIQPEAPFAELFLTEEQLRHVHYIGCYFRTQQEVSQIWYPRDPSVSKL